MNPVDILSKTMLQAKTYNANFYIIFDAIGEIDEPSIHSEN